MSEDASTEPSDETVVQTAAEAAEDVVFSRFDRSEVDDLDVTVTFEDGTLEVDVYLDAPDGRADTERIADDAALAARSAVDDLFRE
ncbi:DUF3194 domain-containing protein [Halorhabdus amylolytica]|uniref:DUF3194 domain-containing protein n=1 Tax=Halorhabdus amylolytica TaxID=2559573 RepID=UPI0010AA2F9F|nr:DUF3194 domain-containing protein [Halorhabdus amylolytica]